MHTGSIRLVHMAESETLGMVAVFAVLPVFRRKRDFLGYYKALGINLEDAGRAFQLC